MKLIEQAQQRIKINTKVSIYPPGDSVLPAAFLSFSKYPSNEGVLRGY